MKKFLGILALSLLICNTAISVDSLTEGQKGTIKFESIPVVTLNQFLKGETEGESCTNFWKITISKKEMDRPSSSCCYATWWWWREH